MWINDHLITSIAILVISLLLWGAKKFYDKFAEELGKQTAEITTIKAKTIKVEAVKRMFNENLELFKQDIQLDLARAVEPLKASLNKDNITYQIYTAEYIKMRFERLDELYARLYVLEKIFCEAFVFSKEYDQEIFFEHMRVLQRDFYKPAEDALAKAFIYIDDDVSDSVNKLLDEIKSGFSLAVQFYGARFAAQGKANETLKERYYELDHQRQKAIEKVNSLLRSRGKV